MGLAKQKLHILTAVVGTVFICLCFMFTCVTAFALPLAGCPGGPDGPPAPGTVCPGGQGYTSGAADPAAKASAADCSQPTSTTQNPTNCQKIYEYLYGAADLLSALVGVVAVAMIIYGGIEFSSSGGDPQKVASAKNHITNAIIALVAFLLLWAFLNFIIPGGLFNGGS